jgi:excisionase family DNA binding protein
MSVSRSRQGSPGRQPPDAHGIFGGFLEDFCPAVDLPMSAKDGRAKTRGGHMDEREYYTRPEAGVLLRWCEETLDKRLRTNEIDSIRVGRKILIPRESLEQYMDRCRAEAVARRLAAEAQHKEATE